MSAADEVLARATLGLVYVVLRWDYEKVKVVAVCVEQDLAFDLAAELELQEKRGPGVAYRPHEVREVPLLRRVALSEQERMKAAG